MYITKKMSILKYLVSLLFVSTVLLCLTESVLGQNVGIGTIVPDSSAILDIKSNSKGVLIPRVSLVSTSDSLMPIENPATGLLVWNSNATVTGGNGIGFYYFDGTQWISLSNGRLDNDLVVDYLYVDTAKTIPPNRLFSVGTTVFTRSKYEKSNYFDNKPHGGAEYAVLAAGTGIADGNLIIDYAGVQLHIVENKTFDPYIFGAFGYSGRTGFDDSDALNNLFKYQSDNPEVPDIDVNGKWLISTRITVGNNFVENGTSARVQGPVIYGTMELWTANNIELEFALLIDNTDRLRWFGNVGINGGQMGALHKVNNWAGRACHDGIRFGVNTNIVMQGLEFKYLKGTGLSGGTWHPDDYTVNSFCAANEFGPVRAFHCGSGAGHPTSLSPRPGKSLYSNYTVDAANSVATNNSFGQKTVLNVLALPPEFSVGKYHVEKADVYIDGHVYEVTAIDRVSNKISIFPRLRTAAGSSGNLMYIFGGAAGFAGADTNLNQIGKIATQACGSALRVSCLYGLDVDIISQFDGVALSLGAGKQSACVGGRYGIYTEAELIPIHQRSAAIQNVIITNTTIAGIDNSQNSGSPLGTSDLQFARYPIFKGMKIGPLDGYTPNMQLWPVVYQEVTNTVNIDFKCTDHGIIRRDGASNIAMTPAFEFPSGNEHTEVAFASRTSINVAPTGSFTFKCPVGYTIANGDLATARTALTLSGFGGVGPVVFKLYLNSHTKVFQVYAIGYAFDYAGTTGVGTARTTAN